MDERRTQLLERFRTLLEEIEEDEWDDASEIPEESADLYRLFVELAALKNEVKIESRQVKMALDQFREMFAVVQNGQDALARELDRRREEEKKREKQLVRQWLLELIELRDRMDAGVIALEQHRLPIIVRWLAPQENSWRASMVEGKKMVLKRLDSLLERHRVSLMVVVGKTLDPHCMRAVASVWQVGKEEGVVTDEYRKGFWWGEEVLRLADVVINKKGEQNT